MSSQGPQSARLYIGGITGAVQQKDVEDLFGKFGKLLEVRINRNFAFVQFSEDSEAQAAIKDINGTQHFGRRLDVQVARYPKGGGGGGGPKDDMPSRDGRDRSPIGRGGGRGGMGGGGMGGGGGGGRGGFRGGDRGGMFNNSGGRGGNFDESGYGGGRGGGGDFRSDFRGGGDFPQRQDGPSPFGRSEGGGGGGNSGLFGPGGNRDFSLAPPAGFRETRGDSLGGKSWGSSGGGSGGGGGGGGGSSFGLNDKAFDTRTRGNDLSRPATHPIEPIAVSNNERTNDIEIIIVDKSLTEYGEMIERRMSCLGFSVDVLFPHEAVPLARVLANIASRGTLYAVVITHVHQINGSLTLHILHGRPQEHRNMAIDDSITLLLRNYESYTRACREKSAPNTPPEQVRHLMTQVLNGRPLTSTQYDIVVQFLLQEKLKLVEPQTAVGRDNTNTSAQAELQTRILSILNKSGVGNEMQQQHPPPSLQPTGPLLQDPSIQKALDSLMQGGDILRKIVPQQQAPFD